MMVDSYDLHQLFWIVRVAEKCLKKNPHARISMDKVISFYSCAKPNIISKTNEHERNPSSPGQRNLGSFLA